MKHRNIAFASLIVCLGIISLSAETLTLDQCVEVALKQNPQIMQGQYYLNMTNSDVSDARSRFLPNASFGMGYSHSVTGPSSKLRLDAETGLMRPQQDYEIESWGSGTSINVSQSVLNVNDIFSYSSQLAKRQSAKYEYAVTRQSIILSVKERYYNLLKAERLLNVQEEALGSAEESFKRAEALFDVGKAPKSDQLKAKVQLETSRLSLIEAQNGLALAHASLNHILGYHVDHEIQVVDNLEIGEVEVSIDEAVEISRETNPSLKMGQSDLKASRSGLKAAYGQFLPSVSAYYNYSWRNEDFKEVNNMFNTDYNWSAGINLSIPIFQGFRRIANINRAKWNYRWINEALSQTEKNVSFELRQAYFDVQQAKKKISVSENNESAAEEDLRLNKEKYNLGSGTMLDLINAQVSYNDAQSQRIQSLYDYKLAVARLEKAMGKLTK